MFETLYDLDKKGVIRQWKIWVDGNIIHTEYGLREGAKIKNTEIVKSGKNIGKKNETTVDEQALAEAQSKWTKKKDKGYSPTIDRNKVNYSPMLAQDYKKQKSKVLFPCHVQPKLDGYRMIYDGINDRILSRTGKPYSILENTSLHKELRKYKNIILDGELYIHDKNFTFESYGVLRKKKLAAGDEKKLSAIKYNVYDVMNDDVYEKRLDFVKKNIKNNGYIAVVETTVCKDTKCIEDMYLGHIKKGYEGAMVRNSKSKYVNKRSSDLLKYKNFDDHEFKIIGFSKEKDITVNGDEPIIFKCTTTEGKSFDVPTKGTREERTKMYKKGTSYIGKKLWVQFFGYTEGGVPRFPKSMREGESSIRNKIL